VGVYLVFASLILPALATVNRDSRHRLLSGYLVAFIGYTSGIYISAVFDLPTGAMVVWSLAFVALGSRLLFRTSAGST